MSKSKKGDVNLLFIFGIHVPLVVQAPPTFSMPIMMKDAALSLIAYFLNVSQTFSQVLNQRNIILLHCSGKTTCAERWSNILIVFSRAFQG